MELTILGKTDSQEISYFTLHIVFVVFTSHWAATSCGAVKLRFFAKQNLEATIIKQISWGGTGPNRRGRAGGNRA